MKLLTTEKARRLLAHPLVNASEVARQFYGNDPAQKRPDQALRRRVSASANISPDTLERLTIIFSRLYQELVDEDVFL